MPIKGYKDYSTDSDDFSFDDQSIQRNVRQYQALSSLMSPDQEDGSLGVRGKNYMILKTSDSNTVACARDGGMDEKADGGRNDGASDLSFLLSSIGDNSETLIQQGSRYLMMFLSNSQRLFWFLVMVIAVFYMYPVTSLGIILAMAIILTCGHQNGNGKVTKRTAKWTVTGLSLQMKDGFLASPPFLDKSGQWRMVIRQKRTMAGIQTMFGLLCTDIFPEVEMITASCTFFCTNQLGQELNTGGMRNLAFKYEFMCPGECGMTRPIRISKKQLGPGEVITIHCSVEFRLKTVTFLKTLSQSMRNSLGGDREERRTKKGKNVVREQGAVYPGDLEFHEEDSLPTAFRPVIRFVQHRQTRTFVWEIPGFTTLMENSELWGIYSPQFFIDFHDVCSIWRMKLLEVQGVFRLHVQLRGLPRGVKQVKLWYLLQLVDSYGDSVIPEHAVCRVKYPDMMNLWDTTRHILYRRDTILERFINASGTLTLRISLQMEPNDLALMAVDSDDWIPNSGEGRNNGGALSNGQEMQFTEILQQDGALLGNLHQRAINAY